MVEHGVAIRSRIFLLSKLHLQGLPNSSLPSVSTMNLDPHKSNCAKLKMKAWEWNPNKQQEKSLNHSVLWARGNGCWHSIASNYPCLEKPAGEEKKSYTSDPQPGLKWVCHRSTRVGLLHSHIIRFICNLKINNMRAHVTLMSHLACKRNTLSKDKNPGYFLH